MKSLLNVTIDTTSIELTYNSEAHNINVGVHLKFDPLTEISGSDLYLTGTDASKWEDIVDNGFYDSGAITLQAVPIPAAILLFGSGMIGLVAVARRKHK